MTISKEHTEELIQEEEKLKNGEMKGFEETLEYHLEVCDMLMDECPIKKDYYKKYGDFGKYPISD